MIDWRLGAAGISVCLMAAAMWQGRRAARLRPEFELNELLKLREVIATFDRQPILKGTGVLSLEQRLQRLESDINLCKRKLDQEASARRSEQILGNERMRRLELKLIDSTPPAGSS